MRVCILFLLLLLVSCATTPVEPASIQLSATLNEPGLTDSSELCNERDLHCEALAALFVATEACDELPAKPFLSFWLDARHTQALLLKDGDAFLVGRSTTGCMNVQPLDPPQRPPLVAQKTTLNTSEAYHWGEEGAETRGTPDAHSEPTAWVPNLPPQVAVLTLTSFELHVPNGGPVLFRQEFPHAESCATRTAELGKSAGGQLLLTLRIVDDGDCVGADTSGGDSSEESFVWKDARFETVTRQTRSWLDGTKDDYGKSSESTTREYFWPGLTRIDMSHAFETWERPDWEGKTCVYTKITQDGLSWTLRGKDAVEVVPLPDAEETTWEEEC